MNPLKRKGDDHLLEKNEPSQKLQKLTEKQENTNETALQMLNDTVSTTTETKEFKNVCLIIDEKVYEYRIDLRKIKKASYPLYMCLEKEKSQGISDNISQTSKEKAKASDIQQPKYDRRKIVKDVVMLNIDEDKKSVMLPQLFEFLETGKNPMNDENVEDFCRLADYLCFEDLEQVAVDYMKQRMAHLPPFFPTIHINDDERKIERENEIIDHLIELIISDDTNHPDTTRDPELLQNDFEFIKQNGSEYKTLNIKINDSFLKNTPKVLDLFEDITTINFEFCSFRSRGEDVDLYISRENEKIEKTIGMLSGFLDKSKLNSLKNVSFSAGKLRFGYSHSLRGHNVEPLLNLLNRFPKFENLRIDFDADDPGDLATFIERFHQRSDHFSLGMTFYDISDKELEKIQELKIPVIRDTFFNHKMINNVLIYGIKIGVKEKLKIEESIKYLESYTRVCNTLSTYPLELLELYPEFVDWILCANNSIWKAERHFGVSDTKIPGVAEFFYSVSKLQVKKLVLRLPHCYVLGYLEACLKNGLKGLEEVHFTGCLEINGYAEKLEKILKERKNLKYSITCGDVWNEHYPTNVIEGPSKAKK